MTTLIPKYDLAVANAVNRPFNLKLAEIVSVKDFGATGNGTTDDTAAIQAAINSGYSIYFPDGTYGITAQLNLTVSNIQLYGNGTIKFLSSYNKTSGSLFGFYVTGNNILFEGLTFDGSAVTSASTNNAFIWNQGAQVIVSKCTFNSLPYGAPNINCAFACTVDATTPNCRAEFNYFNNCPGAIFFKGNSCVAMGNVILNPHDVSIALNGSNCTKCIVIGNVINNSSLNSCAGHIGVEESAREWVIKGNTIFGVTGYGIGANNYSSTLAVEGGIIEGNIINGGNATVTNSTAFISVSSYFNNVLILNNKLINNVTGTTNCPLIIAGATGGMISGNYINEVNSIGSIFINGTIGSNTANGLEISNNISYASQRHYVIVSGDYNNIPIIFKNNKMYGGANGIDSTVSTAPTNLVCYFEDFSDCTVTNPVVLSNIPTFGYRQYFINTNSAWKFPCSIKQNTVMYGDKIPTSGSWALADTIFNTDPISGQPAGWMCSVAGSPGTWVKMANLI